MPKNFVSYDDALEVLGDLTEKMVDKIEPISITWENYQLLTEEEKASNRYIITDYPSTPAEGAIPVDPVDTSSMNIWIVTE